MSQFVFKKEVDAYVVISRFGNFQGEQFEVRLRSGDDWLAFLNFWQEEATSASNAHNGRNIPELHLPPEQYAGVIDILRHESPIWFTLYEEPLNGWLSTSAEPVGAKRETRQPKTKDTSTV